MTEQAVKIFVIIDHDGKFFTPSHRWADHVMAAAVFSSAELAWFREKVGIPTGAEVQELLLNQITETTRYTQVVLPKTRNPPTAERRQRDAKYRRQNGRCP